ncbi:hypothetical protein TL16_g09278 [Triparma laevis f. inornata]|uniref:Uncharacterized protein n=1 Tax=Triparma laevis f. inornata TaxID=1714386 RepID=A0A9W7B245_9STRA|nr:hypothetical protein TL16_g09278 [Triparma laevis f. inornata]
MPSTPTLTTGLTPSIISRYSAFILDQYGVLHDGATPLPGAVDAIKRLKSQNKKLAILSNTSASSASCLERLYGKLGFPPKSFDVAVTSGGECSKYFQSRSPKPDNAPTKVLLFTWSGEEAVVKTTEFLNSLGNVEVVSDPEIADVAISHGSDVLLESLEELGKSDSESKYPLKDLRTACSYSALDPYLSSLSIRNIPMYSANPDLKVITPSNEISYMPGVICKRYESEFNGSVTYFGKPHAEHFLACKKALQITDNSKICHVDDSLHHDILGANSAGISSIFVGSGIHRDECMRDGELVDSMVNEMIEKEGGEVVNPTHCVPLFKIA